MKKIGSIICFLCLLLSSCDSHSEEPELGDKGPWRVIFYEEFVQIHNNSNEFKIWFDNHAEYLSTAKFLINKDNSKYVWEYPSKENVEEYYSVSYCGSIEWYMEISVADEKELKSMMAEFEAFTVIENENDRYDKFTSAYFPLKDTP